eukprot:5153872-Pleurochrysis_carterae.AAC.3
MSPNCGPQIRSAFRFHYESNFQTHTHGVQRNFACTFVCCAPASTSIAVRRRLRVWSAATTDRMLHVSHLRVVLLAGSWPRGQSTTSTAHHEAACHTRT